MPAEGEEAEFFRRFFLKNAGEDILTDREGEEEADEEEGGRGGESPSPLPPPPTEAGL